MSRYASTTHALNFRLRNNQPVRVQTCGLGSKGTALTHRSRETLIFFRTGHHHQLLLKLSPCRAILPILHIRAHQAFFPNYLQNPKASLEDRPLPLDPTACSEQRMKLRCRQTCRYQALASFLTDVPPPLNKNKKTRATTGFPTSAQKTSLRGYHTKCSARRGSVNTAPTVLFRSIVLTSFCPHPTQSTLTPQNDTSAMANKA